MFTEKYPSIKIVHAPERPGDVKHTLSDVSQMSAELGLEDTTPFATGLRKTWDWWDTLEVRDG